MDQNIKDIIDSLNFIKENMATKSELEALSGKIDDVHIELRGKFESLDKRLDMEVVKRRLPERVSAIEQHLGIEQQIAA